MLKTCSCSKPGCKICDCSTYKEHPPIIPNADPSEPKSALGLPQEKFVDFRKLLETEDKHELVDILQKDIRDKEV
jgi:hypothetical protein